jgi:hypothetical protein
VRGLDENVALYFDKQQCMSEKDPGATTVPCVRQRRESPAADVEESISETGRNHDNPAIP